MKVSRANFYSFKNSNNKKINNNLINYSGLNSNQTDTFVYDKNLNLIEDKNLLASFEHLKTLKFKPEDVKYVQSLGVILPFSSGLDAAKFIKDNRVKVEFGVLPSENTHAQYDFGTNSIKINSIYKNNQAPAVLLAISEAILHEAGHAKDFDGNSSVQEEMDCLAMNALSHRNLVSKFSSIFDRQNSPIVEDGVCIYSKLFFDTDNSKEKLIARLKLKYGELPAGDVKHPPSQIAMQVKTP